MNVEGNDEFSELCQDFEEMRRRLKESAEEKVNIDKENRELISNISHDLKTPMTAIKGYVEGIMDGVADTPEKMDRYVRTIYNKTNEMDHLINELTFYSKIDTNRIPYTFSKLNVEDYFSDCAEEVGLELETKESSCFILIMWIKCFGDPGWRTDTPGNTQPGEQCHQIYGQSKGIIQIR